MRPLNEVSRYSQFEFSKPDLGCVLSYTGLPGSGSIIYDRSIHGNNGTITGATWLKLQSGLPYLRFDGSDDKLAVTYSLDSTSAWYVLFWVRRQASTQNKGIVGYSGTWTLWGEGATTLDVWWNADLNLNITQSGVGVWQLIGIGRDGANWVADSNGVTVDTASNANTTALDSLSFGSDGSTYARVDLASIRVFSILPSASARVGFFNQERHLFGV